MMCTYQQKKEQEFITEGGGIRERMTAARLGYRTNQRETIEQLSREIEALKQENDQLKKKRITCKTMCQEDYQMLASKKPTGRRPGFNGETPCKTLDRGSQLGAEETLG